MSIKASKALSPLLLVAALLLPVQLQAQAPSKPAASIEDRVADAFWYGDFAELERLYAEFGKAGMRSPATGTLGADLFWDGVDRVTNSRRSVAEPYFHQLDALTRQWATEHPQSVLAQLLYASSLFKHGWYHRGNGYANTVTPEAWAALGKYVKLAIEHMLQHEALLSSDASWYVELLDMGRGAGWENQQLAAVFEAGIKKHPQDDRLYFTMLGILEPKWGGSVHAMESFIIDVTQRMPEPYQSEMYARLYGGLSDYEVKQELFKVTRASWPKMKAGLEGRLARYPHPMHRNRLAYYACMAKDTETLRSMLEQLGDDFDAELWGSRPAQRFGECKALAHKL